MGIENWSESVILVNLPAEPQIADELAEVTDMVNRNTDNDMVIDFSAVDIVTSSSLSALLKLQKLMTDSHRRLIFCNVSAATKNIFDVTGIDEIFEFVDDKFTALAGLQLVD